MFQDNGSEVPLHYVAKVTLLGRDGKIPLHAHDMLSEVLFSLDGADRASVTETLRRAGLPKEIVEEVDVDESRLLR